MKKKKPWETGFFLGMENPFPSFQKRPLVNGPAVPSKKISGKKGRAGKERRIKGQNAITCRASTQEKPASPFGEKRLK